MRPNREHRGRKHPWGRLRFDGENRERKRAVGGVEPVRSERRGLSKRDVGRAFDLAPVGYSSRARPGGRVKPLGRTHEWFRKSPNRPKRTRR